MTDGDTALATYGTLAPGRANNHQLDSLNGEWTTGHVFGRLVQKGWGAAMGFPALVLDPTGQKIDVHVFSSADLPAHWQRLDAFEGRQYRRIPTEVSTAGGVQIASIYVLGDA